MAGLRSTKLSEMDSAEAIGSNDFLYMVRNTVEAGLVSKKLPFDLLLSMLGGGDGGSGATADLAINRHLTTVSLAELAVAINGLMAQPAPSVTTADTWTITGSYVNTVAIRSPTETGQYILITGPGVLGQPTYGVMAVFLSQTGLEVLGVFNIPDTLETSINPASWPAAVGGTMQDAEAHGSTGDVKWWKTTVTINDGPTMKQPFVASLVGLPAKSDGTLVPYNLNTMYADSRTTIVLVLTIYEPYDKFIDPLTGSDIDSDTPAYNLVYWY